MADLTLYHYWRSSCSWRVRWALAIKGLPYESKPVNLLQGEHKTPAYAKLNPSMSVPTLVTQGTPITDSLAILEWLEEKFPKPALLPSSPLDKAKVRELAYVIHSGTQPVQNLKVMQFHSPEQSERNRWAAHWIREGLNAFEKRVRQSAGTYCVGGQVTLADLCLVPQCYNAERFNVALKEFPTLKGIYERCLNLKECEAAAPHNQPGAMKS